VVAAYRLQKLLLHAPISSLIVIRGSTNVCLVGGGSGHGFKHGSALGEHVAVGHGFHCASIPSEMRHQLLPDPEFSPSSMPGKIAVADQPQDYQSSH